MGMGIGMAVIAMEDADVVVSEEGRTTIRMCISGCWAGKVAEEKTPPGTAVCVCGFDWELPVMALGLRVSTSSNAPRHRRLRLKHRRVYSTQAGCSYPHMTETRNISSPTHRAQSVQ